MKRAAKLLPLVLIGICLTTAALAAVVVHSSSIASTPPNELPGLVTWLDTSDLSGTDGDLVTTWTDKASGHNDMTTNVGHEPTLATGVLNGHPVISFTPSDVLYNESLSIPDTWTVMVVERFSGATKSRLLKGYTGNWLLGGWGGMYNIAYYEGWVHESGPPGDTMWRLYEGTSDGTTGSLYTGGQLIAQAGAVSAPQGLSFNIGDFGNESSDLQVAEIVVFNRKLSDNERMRLERYFHAKWGVPVASEQTTHATVREGLTSGLVGNWRLSSSETPGDTTRDSSFSGYGGSLQSPPEFVAGHDGGTALFFDGGQSVNVSGFSSVIAGKHAMTVTGWVKPGTQSNYAAYFGMRNDTTADFYVLQLNGTNILECRFINSTGQQFEPDNHPTVTPGEWQFVSFVYDGSHIRCAVNGDEHAGTASGAIEDTDVPFNIGTDSNDNVFRGAIGDVHVYDRALSSDELAELQSGGTPMTTVNASSAGRHADGLVAHYTFDGGDLHWDDGHLSDRSGEGHDAGIHGFSQQSAPVVGQLGQAFRFTGAEYLTATNPVSDDFSICAWIETIGAGNGSNHWQTMPIVESETGGIADDFGFGIEGNGRLAFGDGDRARGDFTVISDAAVNDGKWTHVCATRRISNGAVRLYINGAVAKDGSAGLAPVTSNPSIRIGQGVDGAAPFVGLMDEIRIYDRVLTDDEVRTLYLMGS